jgi:lipid-binding SYLF domain-containing protein
MGSEAFLPGTMDKECEKAARILRAFCKEGVYSDSSSSPQQQPGAPPSAATDFKPPPTTTTTTTTTAPAQSAADAKKRSSRVLLTIPPKVIARAQGLAIFTTVRAGFHVSGASGSGILLARTADGSWSPPSGIQVHSVGAGFVVGLDIYDCVVVINTREALEAFTRTRMSLGSDLAVAAGPWGAGGSVDFELPREERRQGREGDGRTGGTAGTDTAAAGHGYAATDHVYPATTTGAGAAPNAAAAPLATPATGTSKDRKPSPFREAIRKPVYSYVKSRGFYAGVQVDGTVITERKDANAAFYGDKTVTVQRILRGDVRPQEGSHVWPAAARELVSVLAAAEKGMVQGQSSTTSYGPGVGHYAGPGGPQYGATPAHGTAPGYGAPPHGTAPTYDSGPAYGSTPGSAPGYAPGYTSNYTPGAGAGMSGVTEGARNLDVHDRAGHPTTGETSPPLPPRTSKAAEAAAEARANESLPAGPPSYHEPQGAGHHSTGEMPPAYEDDGVHRLRVGDHKGGAPGPGH